MLVRAFHERKPEAGAPSGGVLDLDAAPVSLGDLPNDRQAEPRAWMASAGLGAVKAVEDEGPVGSRDAGAIVADGHFAARHPQVDATAAVAPLGRVFDQIPERALELLGIARNRRRLGVESEADPREAGLGVTDDHLGDLVEANRSEVQIPLAATGEVDKVGDEVRQLLDLVAHVLLEKKKKTENRT